MAEIGIAFSFDKSDSTGRYIRGWASVVSIPAGADLTAQQFRALTVNAAGAVVVAGVGQFIAGVQQGKAMNGAAATVRVAGVTKIVAGAAFACGPIASDAQGRAIAATGARTNTSDAGGASDPLVGPNIIGIALEPAGAAGDVVAMLIASAGAMPTTLAA